jgi:riboflavin synthase
MFTGLVETLGRVLRLEEAESGRRLVLDAGRCADGVSVGDSLAVNGVCLTVVQRQASVLHFQVGPETLARTNLAALGPHEGVNLERSLRLGDRLGGHLVQGHVDGLARIADRRRQGEWETVWFACPAELTAQMVPKGSVAVDGISLTLVEVADERFRVALIPHTLASTTLGYKTVGAAVNIEVDIFAKYVRRCLEQFLPELRRSLRPR